MDFWGIGGGEGKTTYSSLGTAADILKHTRGYWRTRTSQKKNRGLLLTLLLENIFPFLVFFLIILRGKETKTNSFLPVIVSDWGIPMYKINIKSICLTESKAWFFFRTHVKNTLSCPCLIVLSKSYQATLIHHFRDRKVKKEIKWLLTHPSFTLYCPCLRWGTEHRMGDRTQNGGPLRWQADT